MQQRLGVIDIGNLKVKLEVVEVADKKTTLLYASNTLTCLGLRMTENHNQPLEENLQATLTELKRCQKILNDQKVDQIRAVSTHALREMGEAGRKIQKKVEKEVGLKIEIISQEEEAELFYLAVTHTWPNDEELAIADVGSGSVQILLGNRKKLQQAHLLKMGAQFLHDTFSPRHQGSDSPTQKEILAMRRYILRQLVTLPCKTKTPLIYGSTCIIDVFKTLKLTNPAPVKQLEKFLHKIVPMSYDEREKHYPFSQKYYMWGIDKAFLVVTQLARHLASPRIIPTNANINQGLILGLISKS